MEGSARPSRRRAASVASGVIWATLAAVAGPAQADSGEWALILEPAIGLYRPTGGDAQLGAGGDVAAWLGLTTAASLFVSVGGAWVSDGPPIGEALGGVALALDVLRTIPFLEVGLGAALVDTEVVPALRLGLGADYLLSPRLSIGGVARYRPAFGRGEEDWLTFSLRLGWRGEF